jgi:hypothetical protein
MAVKHEKQEITIEYIHNLERRLSTWQASLAVIRKLMKEMKTDTLTVGNKKTGEIGIKYLQNYVGKIQDSLFEEQDDG